MSERMADDTDRLARRNEWLEERHERMVELVQTMQQRAQRAESELRRLRSVERGHRALADRCWWLMQQVNELTAQVEALAGSGEGGHHDEA